MGVDALGNYLMTEAEIAAVEEGKTSLFLQSILFHFCQPDVCNNLVLKSIIEN